MPAPLPKPPTDEEQLQSLIQDKLANIDQYDSDGQALIRQAAQAYNVKPRPLNGQQSAAPFLGNMLDQFGANIASIPDTARAIWQQFQPHADPHSLTGQSGGLGSVLDSMIYSSGNALGQQQQRAWQEIKGGDPIYGVGRAILGGIVPGLGPQSQDVIDQSLGKGPYKGQPNPGGAMANALTEAGQVFAPQIFHAATSPIRNSGRNMIQDALGFGSEQRNPSVPELVSMAQATRATGSKSSQAELQDIIKTAESNVDTEIMMQQLQKKNPKVDMQTVMDATNQAYAEYARGGNESLPQAVQLLNRKSDFEDKFKQAGLNLAQAQEQKGLTWKMLNDKDFQKENAAIPGLQKALMLRGTGLKQGIEEAAGQGSRIAENNNISHVAITLKKQLDGMTQSKLSVLTSAIPLAAGIGAGELVSQFGGGHGNTLMLGALGTAGLAHYITVRALRDPITSLKLGQMLNNMGEGAMAQTLTRLPLIGLSGIQPNKQGTTQNPNQ